MNRNPWRLRLLLALVLPLAAPSTLAQSCREKLAELDRLIAENESVSEANMQAVGMMRDMGAQQCEQGNEAAANPILDLQIRNLARRQADHEQEAAAIAAKAKLTPQYLQGDWCTWQVTDDLSVKRDSARYHFYADGSYHLGPPPSYRLDTSSDPWAHERFLAQDYIKLIEMGRNEFRTEEHGMREYIWRRGSC